MAFMAHYRGEASTHHTERDDGHINEMDATMYFTTYEEWPEYEREAMLETRGKTLDVGLGAGRHSLWLQERGHEVMGIDLSPLAVEVSRLRGVKDAKVMDVTNMNFPDGYFDTVLMMGANLGIVGEIPEIRRVLASLDRVSKPDAIIIGSTRDPLKTENLAHLAYHEMNRRREKPPGLVRIRVNFRKVKGEWFDFLMMGDELLAEVLEPTNWKVSKIYGSEKSDYIAILSKKDRP
jgi:ubiquinone/menaquinone biosynthesis C-methylase UbiE